MKAKRIILSVVGVLVALVALVVILWFNEIRTIASVHQVDSDGYLYEMEYSARYDLDDIIDALATREQAERLQKLNA